MLLEERARRWIGLSWASIACPLAGWFVALAAEPLTRGQLGFRGAALVLTLVPAALAAGGNAALGRSGRAVVIAAVLAAAVCVACVALSVIWFLLIVPDDFFN